MFAEVPKASEIRASVQPDPPFETFAFNNIRAYNWCLAALFPLRRNSFRCCFSATVSLTIYLFPLIVVSIAKVCDRVKLLLPLCLVNTNP